MASLSARRNGLMQCLVCHKLLPLAAADGVSCPRCGAAVHSRIPNSLAKTWAYLLASMLLYVPANILPIMTVNGLGGGKTDTIMSGIVSLASSGMLPIAIIVFIASIVVPLLKMVSLLLLLFSVRRRWRWRILYRSRLYRFTELVGRWSMLDIYVIMILVALVSFDTFASIETGPAATAFAAVVVLTMLAAKSFDARLMWDSLSDA